MPIKIEINDIEIEQNHVDKSSKILGARVSPSLKWDAQLQRMKKIEALIWELMNTEIQTVITEAFLNACLIKSACFTCVVFKLGKKQAWSADNDKSRTKNAVQECAGHKKICR